MCRRLAARAAAAVLLAAALACGTKDAADPLSPSGPQGRVRFVNLITDAARVPVNAILEGVPFGVNLGYTQCTPCTLPAPSTASYAAVLAGNRTIVLKRTADTNVVVATISFPVAEGQDQSVYAVGGSGGTTVTSFITTDDNTPPATNLVKLRVVNMSPTAGAVDVFVTPPNADLSVANTAATNLGFRGASTYVTASPGTYQVRAVPTGTAPGSRASAVTVNLPSTAFAGGMVRTIVIADNATGGAPLRAVVLADR